MTEYFWLTAYDAAIFVLAIIYICSFIKKKDRFMITCGAAWIAYGIGVLCCVFFLYQGAEEFLIVRKVMDMGNIVILLLASYSFMHVSPPQYWYRFSLYLMILAVADIIYKFSLLSFYLPISLYQFVISLFLCYNIAKKWNGLAFTKNLILGTCFLWGAGKAAFSIFEAATGEVKVFLVLEIILFISINFSILITYLERRRDTAHIEGNLYQRVIENSKDAIFYYKIRPYKAYEYISPAVESLLGYSPAEFYNNPDLLREIAEQEYMDEMTYFLQEDDDRYKVISAELYTKEGKKLWVEIGCTALRDSNGEIEAIQGSIRDITEIKSAEVELINLTRSRNMLFTYVSHELRTPITSIVGYMTAINDGVFATEEEKAEAMDIISQKISTLKKLIDDLDQLSKLETHQFNFDFQAFNTSELTEMLISTNIGDVRSKGFNIEVKTDLRSLEAYWIIADDERINQVFVNLLSNAMKYSDERKKLMVSFSVDEAKTNYVVSVTDSGTGIKTEDIPFLFDRFYRAEYNRNREGRGLGLTLCKEIIEKHQGTIFVESEYGKGSTFTFIIPLHKEN